MKKFNKKVINVVTTAALVASLAAPVAVFANSTNVVTKVPSVSDDYESGTKKGEELTSIIIKEDDTPIYAGERFRLALPSGAKWVKDAYDAAKSGVASEVYADKHAKDGGNAFWASVTSVSDQTVEFVLNSEKDNVALTGNLELPLFVEIDGAEGAVKADLESIDGTLTSGSYTIANVGAGKTSTVVEKVETISDLDTVGTIRIDETSIGAIYNDGNAQKITLKLPSNFKWNTAPTIQFAGGFVDVGKKVGESKDSKDLDTVSGNSVKLDSSNAKIDDRTLEFYVKFDKKPTSRGTIYLKDAKISAENEANYGDVYVAVSGDKVSSQDVLLATYADYGVNVKANEDAKTLVAGRLADTDDLKLAEMKIKEGILGSLLPNRKTRVEFPSWVKIVDVDVKKNTGGVDDLKAEIKKDIDGTKNYVEFVMNDKASTSSKIDVELQFYVSVKANASGDITAKVSGRSTASGEAVLGKAVVPATATATEVTNLKIGVKEQAISDFVITEEVKEGINKGDLVLELPTGIEWSSKPKVEVVEGDIDLDLDDISKSGRTVTIPVKSESTKPSKIKISAGQIDLDRTIPEGQIEVSLKGSAVVENHKSGEGFDGKKDLVDGSKGNSGTVDAGEFDQSSAAKVVVAKVVTPAPGDSTAEATFTLGSTTYTVDGVEKNADVAAYAENGRTYLPIRYVADALGVSESNILYDKATSTVTLIKDGLVAQMTIGSNILKINGANIPMDAKAQLKDNRTVLPLRYAAQALGATVSFDEATKVITIKK